MTINDVWQLTVKGHVLAQQHIHTLHFLEVGAQNTGGQLITAWQAAGQTAYRGLFTTNEKPVESVEARKVYGTGALPSPTEVIPIPADQLGTRSAQVTHTAPSFVAALVTEKGAVAGRRYSGRFFIGGLTEGDLLANDLDASYTPLLQAYCTALTSVFITLPQTTWTLFAYSRLLGEGDPDHMKRNKTTGVYEADPVARVASGDLAGSKVIALIPSGRPTTMRSRKYGHGN